jgi:zinc and cadmium transporter
MPLLLWILVFTAAGGALSALAAASFLAAPDPVRTRALPHLVSFATGALLGAALLGLLPHAIEAAGPGAVHGLGLALLGGLLLFFLLEKLVLWRHCHQAVCEGHVSAGSPDDSGHHDAVSARLILVGDGFHNVLDGVLVAAAFMTDIRLGVVTSMAVFAHELPQEVGDLAILLHGGMSRRRALALNLLTSLGSVLGGVVAYLAFAGIQPWLPYAIAVAAAGFLYIAVADLIPGLHRRMEPGAGAQQLLFIVLGVVVIDLSHRLAH